MGGTNLGAAPEDHVDERPTRTSGSVDEGVDRFEMGVRDGGLCDRWEHVAVAELAEVFDEAAHVLGRGRDEHRRTGVVVASTDPVLDVAKLAAVFLESRVCKPRIGRLALSRVPGG